MSKRYLEVYQDYDAAMNPRDWDNLGTIVSWHNKYYIGDEGHNIGDNTNAILIYLSQFFDDDELDEMGYIGEHRGQIEPEEILSKMIKNFPGVILPVYIYDHSGISIRTTPFYDPWDSGQVGFIYVTDTKLKKEFRDYYNIDSIKKHLKLEIETYGQYLRGDVYAFAIYDLKECSQCGHVEKEIIDSCGGFYGTDWENNGMTDHIEDENLVKQLLHGNIEIIY